MIETKKDVINVMTETSKHFPQFSPEWNSVTDCINWLKNQELEEEDEE